jgi:hypothetical protein
MLGVSTFETDLSDSVAVATIDGSPAQDLPIGFDRRTELRQRHEESATLVALDGAELIKCSVDNIGPGGMHVTVPVGYGFAVGPRYEVVFGDLPVPTGLGTSMGDGLYATVVRTRIARSSPSGHVGVGLRFDSPIIL